MARYIYADKSLTFCFDSTTGTITTGAKTFTLPARLRYVFRALLDRATSGPDEYVLAKDLWARWPTRIDEPESQGGEDFKRYANVHTAIGHLRVALSKECSIDGKQVIEVVRQSERDRMGYKMSANGHVTLDLPHADTMGAEIRPLHQVMTAICESVQKRPISDEVGTFYAIQLRYLLSLAPVVSSVEGFAADVVGQTYQLMEEVCNQLTETSSRKSEDRAKEPWVENVGCARIRMGTYHMTRGQLRVAKQQADECISLAEEHNDADLYLAGYQLLGAIRYYQGQLIESFETLERARAYLGKQTMGIQNHVRLFGQDPESTIKAFQARCIAGRGGKEEAKRYAKEAIERAVASEDGISIGLALFFSARVHQLFREAEAVKSLGAQLSTLASSNVFLFWTALSMMVEGWARAEEGLQLGVLDEIRIGVKKLSDGKHAYEETGARITLPGWGALIAEFQLAAGNLQLAESALVVAERQAVAEGLGTEHESAYSEIYRVWGELERDKNGDETAAQGRFKEAISIAKQQGAAVLSARVERSQKIRGRGAPYINRARARDVLC